MSHEITIERKPDNDNAFDATVIFAEVPVRKRTTTHGPNEHRIEGDTAFIALTDKYGDTIGEAAIDVDDLERILSFGRWKIVRRSHTNYVAAYITTPEGKRATPYMHRVITNAPDALVVDHQNHNGLDNRRSNLDVVPPGVNSARRKGANANSKSGVRSVCWDKAAGKWIVNIRANGVLWYLGCFDYLVTAEMISIEARRSLLPEARFPTDKKNTGDGTEYTQMEIAFQVADRLSESAIRNNREIPNRRRVDAVLLIQRVEILGGRFWRDARGDWKLDGPKAALDPLMDELRRAKAAIIEVLNSVNGAW